MCKHLCEGAYSSRAGGGSGRGASPLPGVKKILKNANEMIASEDVERTNKRRISSVFMSIYFKDITEILLLFHLKFKESIIIITRIRH